MLSLVAATQPATRRANGGLRRAGLILGSVRVLVVTPHPVHGSALVAAFRRDIEEHVGPKHLLAAAPVAGIGVEDVAVGVLVEHAVTGELVEPLIGQLVVVEDLAFREVFLGERDVKVVVEVVP